MRDLFVICRQAPQTSSLFRQQEPELSQWDLNAYLLAAIYDALNIGNWQRTGNPHAPRPKPLQRPGEVASPSPTNATNPEQATTINPMDQDQSGVFKGEPTSIDDMREWLGWNTPAQSETDRDTQIRDLYAQGDTTYKQLAAQFGVSTSTIGRIVRAGK